MSRKKSPPEAFIKRTLAKAMETPTFVTDGDGDDYYCPRFRMRNRRCLLAPLTTVILTLEKRKLHMYFFLSVNMVVKIHDTIHLKFKILHYWNERSNFNIVQSHVFITTTNALSHTS